MSEAYAVLSDPKKRQRFDSGVDDDDMGGFGGGALLCFACYNFHMKIIEFFTIIFLLR